MFEISGVSKNRALEKLGLKLQCLTEANPTETTFGAKNWEFQIIKYLKNRDSTVMASPGFDPTTTTTTTTSLLSITISIHGVTN